MNFKDVIRRMHDDSRISYNAASLKMGRAQQYISALLQNNGNPRLDTCAAVANVFGFRLIVRGNEVFYSIKRSDDEVADEGEIPAEDAIRRITDACPQTNYAISKAMGKSTAYIASVVSRGAMPTIETFVAIAEACGDEVFVRGHSKTYYLSHKAKLVASNGVADTVDCGESLIRSTKGETSTAKSPVSMDKLDVFEAIESMKRLSKVSLARASRMMGHRETYLGGVLREKRMPSADRFSYIASAFGFALIVMGGEQELTIKRTAKDVRHNSEISAAFVLGRLVQGSPFSEQEIATKLGIDVHELDGMCEAIQAPKVDTLIHFATACGYQVILRGRRTIINLTTTSTVFDGESEFSTDGVTSETSTVKDVEASLEWPWSTSEASARQFGDVPNIATYSTERPERQHENLIACSVEKDIVREYTNFISAAGSEDKGAVSATQELQTAGSEWSMTNYAMQVRDQAQEATNVLEKPSPEECTSPVATMLTREYHPSPHDECRLAEYKKRLLDLSMRNNLLNYRDKKTGTIHVLIPDMQTAYRRIVLNERPMTFRESDPDDEEQQKPLGDTVIVTERTRADLIRSLRRLDTVARTSIDEQGINILYLAFGMLKWIDDTHKEHTAPLVLAPMKLTRTSVRSSFHLQVGDDDPVVNPTLAYFLEQSHGIKLPPFEKESQLQRFLVTVANLVQAREGWSVSSDVVLSTFQFQKLSMYHDLEARSDEILAHPVVRAIMGDGSALGETVEVGNPDLLKPTDTYQVVDADASQQAAILAAHAGESFVLQGPPGTGKSQTITNIIADCLGSGKTVLFVSEKKAALDVVHRRLTQSKLDDFCLVLHSNKAGKKEVLGQLDRTLGLYGTRPRMSAVASTRLDTMVRLRDELNGYASAVYEPLEPLGRSPYDVIGIVARYERDGVPWVSCHIDGIAELTPELVTKMTDAVRTYARELGRLGESPELNSWNTFGITRLEYGESGEVLRDFSQVARGARELMKLWNREIVELELDVSPTYDALEASVGLLNDLSKMPVVPSKVADLSADVARKLVSEWEVTSNEVGVSRDLIVAELAELARLDPGLDLCSDERRMLEVGYSKGLAEELTARLESTRHYAAWRRVSEADIDMVLARLRDRVDSYERHKGTILSDYHPELLNIDFIAMETRFKTEYKSFFKRMFGQHGDDIKTLAGLRRSSSQVDDEEALRILALLHDLANEERSLDERASDFENMLGECYRGMQTDFQLIAHRREALVKAKECLDLLGQHELLVQGADKQEQYLSEVFGDVFCTGDDSWTGAARHVIDALEELRSKYDERSGGVGLGNVIPLLAEKWIPGTAEGIAGDLRAELSRRSAAFKRASERAAGADLGRRSLDQLAEAIDRATAAGSTSLERSVSYARSKKVCSDLGLTGFIDAMLRDKRSLEQDFLDQYDQILRHTIYRMWLGLVALAERPALREFSAREQERRVGRFTELDAEQLDIDQTRVLAELFPRIPSPNVRTRGKDEISILRRELNKKARIRPIRKLFSDIPHAVLALKPCLMMSPLSVSTYLESATFQFDTVIFDEASQVRTEDALGVISRGKQVIIAGDSKQLPPTNFFAATVADDDDFGDEDYYEQAGSFDSVLDEAALLSPISLKWHYRSRDESLITFSNEEIYDGDLFTFPSNRTSGRDSGVEYVYVPNGVYEGSRKGNAVEAARVADLVMAHFATYGNERSLGVIALGENQARVIEDELVARRLASPSTERFFDTGAEEAFFVKNLENVQGDERDTIILSVGYAKGPNGRLSHNFGPINMEGGERRLNVAVTRARINLKLVTSIDPPEIDDNRVSNVGPRMLKDYLTYAKVGPRGDGAGFLREYGYVDDDDFAGVVRDTLTDSGFEVEEHVGRSGCKVDLAVRHPEHRDCYCIGIVCDGDSYHAATTARDRDRLRSQVLKGMGWSLYHVWSRSWLQDARRQADLLIDAVKAAVESFVPPAEREPVGVAEVSVLLSEGDENNSIASDDGAGEAPQEQVPEKDDARSVLDSEYLEITHHVEEHRYGFQDYPEYHPPRRGAISDEDLLRQLIYAQAPFSVDYFLEKYREYCYPSGKRMNEAIRRSGIGYLQTKFRDAVLVRKEHDVEYVFRRDQRVIIPRVAGSRTIADISASELREGVLAVLRGYMGELDRKTLIEETAAAFEFARRGRNIEQRIAESIDDLRLYGKVKVIDGYYVPSGR